MLELSTHFTGTYAKNILADWAIISDYIRQQTTWVKDTIQTQSEENPLKPVSLTDQQINDALNGPLQQFFKPHLHAYAAITKMDTALTILKEDFFKESEHINEKIFAVPEQLLATMEFSTLKELRNQLNAQTKEHYAQWESAIQNWTKTLLLELMQNLQSIETNLSISKKNKLTLSNIEIQDFNMNQPVSELNDRFINLKVELPKLSKSEFDFQQYFTLKATLAIHSALSRSEQPSTEKDIMQLLKTLQPTLKQINQAEKELSVTQEKALNELIAPIKF